MASVEIFCRKFHEVDADQHRRGDVAHGVVDVIAADAAAGVEETEACPSAEGVRADHQPRGVVNARGKMRLLMGEGNDTGEDS